jgi:hypothetical protein
MIRILLHAANGVGLGHVVRMSIFQTALRKRLNSAASIHYFSTSADARSFLGEAGRVVWSKSPAEAQALGAYRECIELVRPHLLMCDTWWPREIVQDARKKGIRTVLVSRLIGPKQAIKQYGEALEDFDAIVLCGSRDEAAHFYALNIPLLDLVADRRILIAGRVGRVAPTPPPPRASVLFTLGGGGNFYGIPTHLSVASLVRHCMIAADEIEQLGALCMITQGPLMDPLPAYSGWRVVASAEPHLWMTERTVVVTRPGNLTPAEAIAAGSRLILIGTPPDDEEVRLRAEHLVQTGLAVQVDEPARLTGKILVELKSDWDPNRIRSLGAVNAGLAGAIDHILGDSS